MENNKDEAKQLMEDMKKITCPFCGRNYDKGNKPYIMKCGHNICNRCLKYNVSSLICIRCKYNCSQREISKFPVNFLLADIVDKLDTNSNDTKKKQKKKKEKDKEKEEELYFCNYCSFVNTNRSFHESKFKDHDLIDYRKYISSKSEGYNSKEKVLMDKFKETKENYIQIHKDYFSLIINNIFLRLNDLSKNVENSEFLDNIVSLGLINITDKIHLKQFSETYSKEFLNSVIKESKFDQIYNLEVRLKKNNEYIILENEEKRNYINEFLTDLHIIEPILKKLAKLEKNLEEIDKKLSSLDIKELTKSIFEDIIIQTNHLLNINFKKKDFISFSHHLTPKLNLIIFNPITNDIETYNLNKVKDIENIFMQGTSLILDEQKQLYFSGGINNNVLSNDLYRINLSNLEATKMLPMIEGRCYHHSFIRDNKYYVIMGKTFNKETNSLENIMSCEKLDIYVNEWKKLPNFPKTVKGITSFFCDQNYNFGIDNLKRIFYLNEKNRWKECNVNFKDPVDIDLRNFLVIPKEENIYLIGGIDNRNELSDKIYKFSSEDEEISLMKNVFCKKIHFDNNNYSNFNNNYYIMETLKDEKNLNKYNINIYKTSNLKEAEFYLERTFDFIDE